MFCMQIVKSNQCNSQSVIKFSWSMPQINIFKTYNLKGVQFFSCLPCPEILTGGNDWVVNSQVK